MGIPNLLVIPMYCTRWEIRVLDRGRAPLPSSPPFSPLPLFLLNVPNPQNMLKNPFLPLDNHPGEEPKSNWPRLFIFMFV